MGIINRIHHIELRTKSFESIHYYLTRCLGFRTVGNLKNKCVLRSGSATFLVEQSINNDGSDVDTVYDIALEVDNVADIVNRAMKHNVEILSYPKSIQDVNGLIEIAQIKSCVGNIVHTLINRKCYNDIFLPDCKMIETQSIDSCLVNSFDHVTLVVTKGNSDSVIEWYNSVFDVKRVLLNSDDSITEGFVVHHNEGGMRLKAFDYWRCSSVAIENEEASCKFVIAEELNENVPNQIGTFLREHNGPGIQHIGLLVKDLRTAVAQFHANGATFMTPPSQYYDLIQQRLPLIDLGIAVQTLAPYGILVDCEKNDIDDSDRRYLLQTFSKPIFDRNTFFLEVIERQGATGFGAGNIKALWDAVDATFALK